MAVKDCYTNYQAQDYNKPYDLLARHPELSPTIIDEDRFGIDDQDPIRKTWPAIVNVKSLMFRYQAHQTSNADNSRNTLRYGQVNGSVEVPLWGFDTYLEFKDHLNIEDKYSARDMWEELKCMFAGTHAKFVFWVPKLDSNTRPGCWAITIDKDKERCAVVWADGQYHEFVGMRLTKQNFIKLGD